MVVANATKRRDAGRSILPERPHVGKLSRRGSEVIGLELRNDVWLKQVTNSPANTSDNLCIIDQTQTVHKQSMFLA